MAVTLAFRLNMFPNPTKTSILNKLCDHSDNEPQFNRPEANNIFLIAFQTTIKKKIEIDIEVKLHRKLLQ